MDSWSRSTLGGPSATAALIDEAPTTEPIEVRRGPLVPGAPAVSVVIPAWQCPYLDEALESVRAQTFRDFEIVVVDDGSPTRLEPRRTDDLVLVRAPNGGAARARNRGMQLARGELVALLDSDDRWRPDKLERQVALHRRFPGCVLSCTDCATFDEHGAVPSSPPLRVRADAASGFIALERVFWENPICCSTTMMRRDALARTRGMDPRRRVGEDYGLWLRLALLGPVGYVEGPLTERRMHAASIMHRARHDGSWIHEERAVYEELLETHPALRTSPALRAALARLDYQAGGHFLATGEWAEARRALLRSLRVLPRRPRTWVDVARAVLHIGPLRRPR